MGTPETTIAVMFSALFTLSAACGGDGGDGGGDGDGDGDRGGEDAQYCDADPWLCDGPDPDLPWVNYDRNLDCPGAVPPHEGPGAERGPCCHRGKPNSVLFEEFDAREQAGELEPDELMVSSFRASYSATINHPLTVGAAPLPEINAASTDLQETQLVFTFAAPRAGGEPLSGAGWAEIGAAAYNCEDGSYSRYSDTAAPVTPGGTFPNWDDPSRYAITRVPNMINLDAEDPDAWATTNWADVPKGPSNGSSHDPRFSQYVWDYDLISQGFNVISLSGAPQNVDCHGMRDVDVWAPHDTDLFEAYIPMAANNHADNGIWVLGEMTLCSFFAFGLRGDPVEWRTLDCETVPRCEPGSADCRWLKLPDSLCPVTPDTQALWDCHVGDVNHSPEFEGDRLRCDANVPTRPYTIRGGPDDTGILGQCCDPIGESDTLPACNAWRTLNNLVLSSAVVRQDKADAIFRACP